MTRPRDPGILAGPLDGPDRAANRYPAVEARRGMQIVHRGSGYSGALAGFDGSHAVIRGATGLERRFVSAPGAFLVGSRAVQLVAASDRPAATDEDPGRLAGGRIAAGSVTASGSRAVVGARARVARASRILVEGIHDAELVEKVWGDDLRIEGIVVERLDGIDHLDDELAAFRPAPGRRVGVLVDHLVAGSKETRVADAVQARYEHVLVTGTPYVDVWEAVRPAILGIDAWPVIPRGRPWKEGVCAALGVGEPGPFWRHILASVTSWKDLEQPFLRAVEELIDFVTDPGR